MGFLYTLHIVDATLPQAVIKSGRQICILGSNIHFRKHFSKVSDYLSKITKNLMLFFSGGFFLPLISFFQCGC